jgi:hypothetical protein
MEDPVDHTFGGPFQLGIHGEKLLEQSRSILRTVSNMIKPDCTKLSQAIRAIV